MGIQQEAEEAVEAARREAEENAAQVAEARMEEDTRRRAEHEVVVQ